MQLKITSKQRGESEIEEKTLWSFH